LFDQHNAPETYDGRSRGELGRAAQCILHAATGRAEHDPGLMQASVVGAVADRFELVE
jgi:hypothetical protein